MAVCGGVAGRADSVADEVRPARENTVEVRVRRGDTGVDDGDDDPFAPGLLPRERCLQLVQNGRALRDARRGVRAPGLRGGDDRRRCARDSCGGRGEGDRRHRESEDRGTRGTRDQTPGMTERPRPAPAPAAAATRTSAHPADAVEVAPAADVLSSGPLASSAIQLCSIVPTSSGV